MTKTDKSGIVTRNCATIKKDSEGCVEDREGALLCYCLTDYCNGAVVNGNRHAATATAMLIASFLTRKLLL